MHGGAREGQGAESIETTIPQESTLQAVMGFTADGSQIAALRYTWTGNSWQK